MKLKNFTLEGEVISLIAHLSYDQEPRFDIFINNENENALSSMDNDQFESFKARLQRDLRDLENGYETTYLLAYFNETWEKGGRSDHDWEESCDALREGAE